MNGLDDVIDYLEKVYSITAKDLLLEDKDRYKLMGSLEVIDLLKVEKDRLDDR